MAKVKIVKNERDPPLFTGKLLIKFQNILRNTTQVIIRHRVKILFFRHIKSNNSGTAKVKIGKNERDPPLFIDKLLRNTTQVIILHRICLQTDGHGETSIPLYNFIVGGIITEGREKK